MRLIRATVNGFGNWVDQSIDFEDESLICLYGENEAGKSTMQQFILFMLFGLSPKWRTFYRPKSSSRMGGRLQVRDEATGEYTIERFDEVRSGQAVCYTPDGNEYSEAWLTERLQGMTYQTYQSIFSFSATDLYGIQTMTEADLGDVLLGIGLTGSKNILAIEKDLDNRMGDLFKPYGKKPVMNQQLDKLDNLSQQLADHKHEESAYRDKKMYIQSLESKWIELHEAYTREKEMCTLLEKQHQALPLVEEYKYCIEQLSLCPDSLSFPENGLERLAHLNEYVLPLESELSVLKDNDKENSEKVAELTEQLYDDTVYGHAEKILSKKQLYVANKRDIKMLHETIENETLQLQTELEQLQLGLTMEDLEQMPFPFYLERTWHELKQTSDQIHIQKEQSEDEQFLLNEKWNRIETERSELESVMPEENEIMRLTEIVDVYHRHDYVRTQVEQETSNKTKWEYITRKKRNQSKLIFGGCGLLSILIAVTTMMGMVPNITYIASLFVLMAGISQWLFQKQSIKTLSTFFKTKEMSDMDQTITEDEKENARQRLHAFQKNQEALHTLLEKKKSVQVEKLQWEEKESGLRAKEARLAGQIEAQYDIYPFLKKTNVAYWTELYHKLKSLQQSIKQLDKRNENLAQLEDSQAVVEQDLDAFFEQHHLEYDKNDMASQFNRLDNLMDQYHECKASIRQYEEWMANNKKNQHKVLRQIATYEKEMAALYQHANVHTAEEFHKTANTLEEKEKLKSEKRRLEHQITAILPPSEFHGMVSGIFNSFELQEKIEQAEFKMKELTTKIEGLRQERARENVELTNMETSEGHSELKQYLQMEQEQFQKWGYEWSVLKTAKEMLIDTKRIYRDKYLQRVIDKTSTYFFTLTDGRYIRIFAPSKDTLFQVESKESVRYNVRELSKGTLDQLYISLRIAISDVLSQESLLPFIMDDAFVHFDSIRMERMMHIFSKLSQKQQIIIFTSNKDIFQSEHHVHRIVLGNVVRNNA